MQKNKDLFLFFCYFNEKRHFYDYASDLWDVMLMLCYSP